MKIQVNQRGSWRNFVSFDAEGGDGRDRFLQVGGAVEPLARVLGERTSWRITEDDGAVIAYLDAPDYVWRRP